MYTFSQISFKEKKNKRVKKMATPPTSLYKIISQSFSLYFNFHPSKEKQMKTKQLIIHSSCCQISYLEVKYFSHYPTLLSLKDENEIMIFVYC